MGSVEFGYFYLETCSYTIAKQLITKITGWQARIACQGKYSTKGRGY